MTQPILDACCGQRMMYFDRHDPDVLFQDIREVETTLCDGRRFEVKPDVVGDFTSMEYPDASFRMVVFDPPHLVHNSQNEPTGWQKIKYGSLPPHGWREMLRKGFAECFRVLKDDGFLIFKWNATNIPVSQILELTTYRSVFGHPCGKRGLTHWMVFIKNDGHHEDKVIQAELF